MLLDTILGWLQSRIKPLYLKLEVLRGHTFINRFDSNSVLVDLGANRGEFSRLMSERYPFSKVVMVEANPDLAQELKTNFNQERFQVINAAVGPESRSSVKFHISNDPEASSIIKSFSEMEVGARKEVEVQMVTLEDIFSACGLKQIALLKMDLEGAEWDVLDRFSRDDYERIDQLSVEFHDFNDSSLRQRTEACINRLKSLGYSLHHTGADQRQGTPYMDCLFHK
ncbi:MAG: FkbM family methyltransferase [Candidatus Margulisbacteria bacterium]|nr:FkbM family methyltransferase [Candidatus Margulisiibacteriota bacterium]